MHIEYVAAGIGIFILGCWAIGLRKKLPENAIEKVPVSAKGPLAFYLLASLNLVFIAALILAVLFNLTPLSSAPLTWIVIVSVVYGLSAIWIGYTIAMARLNESEGKTKQKNLIKFRIECMGVVSTIAGALAIILNTLALSHDTKFIAIVCGCAFLPTAAGATGRKLALAHYDAK
ncbi:hypothetical protein [Paraburkholderia acidiphila]|uniref:Uncharacterized protein n=1 Tax=Paraburkholderia acidiphila TaxID=2571747 RepID=A0A7Z2G4P1_9BURK|nr:hypothetical protein [Paraburkholderia acidiphila]QGZ55080.1 hypothetical protein FAZ97_09205 [Paraburkholderia acidiphila]